MKVILAHDSFTQYGGAERVFEAIHEIYPSSPVYTLAVDDKLRPRLKGWELEVSPLQFLYKRLGGLQKLFPLIPIVLRFFRTGKANVLLSSSSAYLKGLIKPGGGIHVNYCHTPTRFVWSDVNYALRELPVLLRPFGKIYLSWLKAWDLRQAEQVDFFIANSVEVQKRIKKYYHRDSTVVYPFVDTTFWKPVGEKGDYFLIAGRLAPYKGHDEVIRAFNKLGLPLHVVGTGRNESHLKNLAEGNIVFLGNLSDDELRLQYSGAKAFIYPQLEDFGIMPLEAAGCGTPTIALAQGGALETIIPGVTGELLDSANAQEIMLAVESFDTGKYQQSELIAQAAKFGKERFQKEIKDCVKEAML